MKKLQDISLSSREQQALQHVAAQLKKKFPVEQVILFGSKARGEGDEYSDVDLLLILSSHIDWKAEQTLVAMLFDLGMEYDLLLSTLRVPVDEWEGGIFTEFPIYQDIMRDGAYVA